MYGTLKVGYGCCCERRPLLMAGSSRMGWLSRSRDEEEPLTWPLFSEPVPTQGIRCKAACQTGTEQEQDKQHRLIVLQSRPDIGKHSFAARVVEPLTGPSGDDGKQGMLQTNAPKNDH